MTRNCSHFLVSGQSAYRGGSTSNPRSWATSVKWLSCTASERSGGSYRVTYDESLVLI